MNFVKTFQQGKLGKNFGLTTGLHGLDKAINGIQRKMTIGVVAAPKVGKTTFTDYAFVLSPYLQAESLGMLDKINWIYFSYEIDRVSKEFKFAAFFMAHDHNVYNFVYKGTTYPMNQDYLMGRLLHTNPDGSTEIVIVSEQHENLLKEVYLKRIIPIFGEYNDEGIRIRPGKIDFIEDPENPTGLHRYLLHYADQHGKFRHEKYKIKEEGQIVTKERIIGYDANDPELFTVVVTDHIRKMKRERGFTMKDNIDKWLEYSTFLRNICGFTFVHICHSNRGVSNVDRLKFAGEFIYPTADDVKDSGNIAEECTVLLTMFNPNDEKYNLEKHFGVELKDYPNYRSVHVADSRYTECPAHIQTNMYGGINMFTPLNVT